MFLFVEVSPIDWSSEHWAGGYLRSHRSSSRVLFQAETEPPSSSTGALTHSLNHPPTCSSLTHSVTHQPTTCSTIPNWTSSANQLIFNFQKILKKDDFWLKNHLKLHLTLYMSYIFWKHYDQGRWCRNNSQIYSEPPGTSSLLCAQNGPWPNTASHALFFLFLFCQNHHLLTLFNHSSPFKYWACSESIIVFWVIQDSTAHTQDSGLSYVSHL